jgi:hypothetical protein
MFLAWTSISGWSGTPIEFIQAITGIAAIALIAGWIVGGRSVRSIRGTLFGIVAYPAVAWLIALPIGVVASTWSGVIDGSVRDPAAVIASSFFLLLYGAVSALYLIPLLTPFGAGWAFTYYLLRRGMGV